MAIKRPKPEEIVVKLRQVEVLMGQGMPRIDAIRQIDATDANALLEAAHWPGPGLIHDRACRSLSLPLNSSSTPFLTQVETIDFARAAPSSVFASKPQISPISFPTQSCDFCSARYATPVSALSPITRRAVAA